MENSVNCKNFEQLRNHMVNKILFVDKLNMDFISGDINNAQNSNKHFHSLNLLNNKNN